MEEYSDPKLVIVHGEESGTTFFIPEGEVVIGSGLGAHIPLRYEGVSRRHALLHFDAGKVTVVDLGSLNGTWINGRKISGPTRLNSNDLLQFGRIKVRLSCGDAITRAAPISHTRTPSATIHTLPNSAGLTATRPDIPKAVRNGSRRMPVERGDVTPWYRRSRRLLIGAGTAAAALGSVLALWDRGVDLADVATIKSVSIAKRTALAEFPTQDLGKNIKLSGDPNAAAHADSLSQIHIGAAVPALLPSVPTQHSVPTAPAPIRTGSGPEPSTITPKPTPAVTSSPTIITTPSEISSRPIITTPSETSTPTPTIGSILRFPSDAYREAVQEQLKQDDLPREVADVPPDSAFKFLMATNSASVDANGQLLQPAQVAEALKQALTEVEIETGSQATDGVSQPMGWTVAVALELEGLANIPLVLTWSLDGIDVSSTWRAENLAYRIVASTQHDAGTARIWIPDLKKTGAYNVNVRLTYESKEIVAAEGQLQLPNK